MSARVDGIAAASLIAMTGLAFAMAPLVQESGWLSLTPPPTEAMPNPAPDTPAESALPLYQAAFTAWAALILLIPAYWFYLTRGPGRRWLAFWTASYLAYLVHLYVSAFLFFGGDFAWMTSSSRVSAFWPGMALIPWWGADILLALRGTAASWVRLQRGVLHLGTFVLFFGGSAVKGEMLAIKLIGAVFALVVILGLIRRMMGQKGAPA